MKRELFTILIAVAAIFGCISFGACNAAEDKIIHTVYTVGTYSGYRVDLVWVEYTDAEVNTVVVKYQVDDVYISTLPDPSYKYYVYKSEKDYVTLKNAYEEGLVTHDDLLAIAEAEKPYDNLYDENTTGPVVPR